MDTNDPRLLMAQACCIYLSSFNINTKKTLGDTCVSSLSTVWKEGGSDKVPGKKGVLGENISVAATETVAVRRAGFLPIWL